MMVLDMGSKSKHPKASCGAKSTSPLWPKRSIMGTSMLDGFVDAHIGGGQNFGGQMKGQVVARYDS